MDLFKKKEPLIVADMAADVMPPLPPGAPASGTVVTRGSAMSTAGSLTKMVEQTLALEEENNRMLHQIQTMDRVSFWIKMIVWALVLGLPVIFFQPLAAYLKQVLYENQNMFTVPSSEDFYRVVDEFSTKYPVQ